jgi:hypothetical protein
MPKNMDIKRRFDLAMYELYRRAKDEAHYNAIRYLHMLDANGGLATAHTLINGSTVTEGYTALWERGRLDLTVEALIVENPEFHTLFTEAELRIAEKRLRDYHYTPSRKT